MDIVHCTVRCIDLGIEKCGPFVDGEKESKH
jgi:hypothetical protein